MNKQAAGWNNWLLVLGVVLLAGVPLVSIRDSDFGGADGKAQEAIEEIQPDYKPWFKPLLEPPGTETASLLFALQAAAGAGAIGYAIGFYRGRSGGSTRILNTEAGSSTSGSRTGSSTARIDKD